MTRYLYDQPLTVASAPEVLERKMGRTALVAEGDSLNLAVVLRDGAELVGDVTLFWRSRQHGQGEIGFVFHPAHGGVGYATEASGALVDLAFTELGLHRVYGRCDARNTASARVLERLGMRREAHLVENELVKGTWTDELVYAVLDREWRARIVAP